MEFESYDDVYFFYNCYAKQQGFGVRVSNTWYRKSKERYRGKLSCSSAGFKKKTEANRPRPNSDRLSIMIKFRLMENSKRWRIIEIELEHNHLTSPISANSYKSHRIMDLGSKRPLPIDEVHKTRLFRTVVIDVEDNGILNADESEIRSNFNQGNNKLKLKQGDAREMLDFFTKMQLSNPSFFYVTDINEKGCVRNVFWADAKCRGLIVILATVAHIHGGPPPQTVITSQCKFLQTAISDVFPRAFHCLSLTNITTNIPSELECDAIRKALTRAVYHSVTADEFEAAWEEMVQSHGLTDHKWLQTLYEDRKRWVPVYLKEVFLAGMFPIKENERLASPFEEYLSRHTSLKEFLRIYDRALLEIDQREASHALSVINQIGLEEIPPQYVLARWRKDIKRNYIVNYGSNGIDINNPVHRYDNLYKCVLKVVEEGRKSHDRYKFASQSLVEILNKVRIQEDYRENTL
ncbi:hypothetical protein DH2020_016526 [Rehmannia glutinosa]|uniref:Protein FAR1-RELATED SEQUENCE n=1 Tax=Rehmannia glutinosa TaxID=99300 RepID=A0ABR0WN79_REHGL